jgi:hypothetical protein
MKSTIIRELAARAANAGKAPATEYDPKAGRKAAAKTLIAALKGDSEDEVDEALANWAAINNDDMGDAH